MRRRIVLLVAGGIALIALGVGAVAVLAHEPEETVSLVATADLEADGMIMGRAEIVRVNGTAMLKLGWDDLPDHVYEVWIGQLLIASVREPGRYPIDPAILGGNVELRHDDATMLSGRFERPD